MRQPISAPEPAPIVLESPSLRVHVRADQGGRVSSLLAKDSDAEFLTQAVAGAPPVAPALRTHFRDGPCAGIEDCLPTVGPCGAETLGGPVPDHGDLWQLCWAVLEQTATAVHLEAHAFSRPLLVRKHISVQARTLTLAYQITNRAMEATSLLFAAHPLLQIEAGDRVCLPTEVRALDAAYACGDSLQHLRGRFAWPRPFNHPTAPDLSITRDATESAAAMLYSDRLATGVCGLYRAAHRQGLVLRFNTRQLPYLGIWLCYGGWPNLPGYPSQYAVALEPTTAPCGTLAEAQQRDQATHLAPQQSIQWQIAFEATPPGQTYTEFLSSTGI